MSWIFDLKRLSFLCIRCGVLLLIVGWINHVQSDRI